MQHKKRIEDLLNRLADLGADTGLADEDLAGDGGASEPLHSAIRRLSELLWAVHTHLPVNDVTQFRSQLQRLKVNAKLGGDSVELDSALTLLSGMQLSSGPLHRLTALETLTGMVQAAVLVVKQSGGGPSKMQVDVAYQDCPASTSLRTLASHIGIANIEKSSAADSLSSLANAMQNKLDQLPDGFQTPLLIDGGLTDAQMASLQNVDQAMKNEYTLRRKMLLERARVTMGSFLCSNRLQSEDGSEKYVNQLADLLQKLPAEPASDINQIFSASLDDVLTIITQPSSKRPSSSSAKNMLIGKVPDRGGRAESRFKDSMPAWSTRKTTAAGQKPKGPPKARQGANQQWKKKPKQQK